MSKDKASKVREIYTNYLCQHLKIALYSISWLMGLNSLPPVYTEYISKKYGLVMNSGSQRKIEISYPQIIKRHDCNGKFTLPEFNECAKQRAKEIPPEMLKRVGIAKWKKLLEMSSKMLFPKYQELKNRILDDNIRLIRFIFKRAVSNRSFDGVMSREDAESDAYIAASRAFDNFFIGVGKLSTYIAYPIEQFVKEKSDQNISAIKTPGYIQQALRSIKAFRDEYGRDPTASEIANLTGAPKGRVQGLIGMDYNNIVSLDSQVDSDEGEDGTLFHEIIGKEDSREESLEIDDSFIDEIFSGLGDKEKSIACYKFGLKSADRIALGDLEIRLRDALKDIEVLCAVGSDESGGLRVLA